MSSTSQLGLILGDSTNLAASTEGAALFLIKILLIVAGFLYVCFGVIVTRQTAVMKKTLITPIEPAIQLLGLLHLFVALGIFVFFLFL